MLLVQFKQNILVVRIASRFLIVLSDIAMEGVYWRWRTNGKLAEYQNWSNADNTDSISGGDAALTNDTKEKHGLVVIARCVE